MMNDRDFNWYLTFISIVFGVFITLWLVPFSQLVSAGPADRFTSLVAIHGYFMLMILVCLWWWYGLFLGQIAPANGFVMYVYDFLSLGSFAAAARIWVPDELLSFSDNSGSLDRLRELTSLEPSTKLPIVIAFSSFLMAVRFFDAYKWCPPNSGERRALIGAGFVVVGAVLWVLTATGTNLLGGSFSLQTAIPKILAILMGFGIVATVYAVYQTEGARWGASSLRANVPVDKLNFIELGPTSSSLRHEFLDIMRYHSSGSEDIFAKDLRGYGLWNWNAVHNSKVHTRNDVVVQSDILAIPGLGAGDHERRLCEIRDKSYLTYFSHWIDDLYDGGFVSNRRVRKFVTQYGSLPSPKDITGPLRRKKISKFFEHQKERQKGNPYFDVGIDRIILGSLIFDDSIKNIEDLHNSLIDNNLEDKSLRTVFDPDFVKLTTKTIQEIWMGAEEPKPNFDLTFLYSVLYAPALYFHDNQEEIVWKEIKGEWGHGKKEHKIREVSERQLDLVRQKILEYYCHMGWEANGRMLMRIFQIRCLAASFCRVLPPNIYSSYLEIADELYKSFERDADASSQGRTASAPDSVGVG